MPKQQSMALRTREVTFTPSIEMHLDYHQEILQRLFSTLLFTGQEIKSLVRFLEVVQREANREELPCYLESAVSWSLPKRLSKCSGDEGISLVLTVGNYTYVQNTLL